MGTHPGDKGRVVRVRIGHGRGRLVACDFSKPKRFVARQANTAAGGTSGRSGRPQERGLLALRMIYCREQASGLAFRAHPDKVDLVSRTFQGHIPQMITHKTKYALKSLMVLADEKADTGEALRIEEIAERSGAPKRFLEHILLDLKRAGLIGSRRGRNGGYELIKEARHISIAEVLRLIDGPMAPLPCLSRRAYRRCEDCKDEQTCRVRAVFGGFYATYILMIESLTLADLQQDADPLARFSDAARAAGE